MQPSNGYGFAGFIGKIDAVLGQRCLMSAHTDLHRDELFHRPVPLWVGRSPTPFLLSRLVEPHAQKDLCLACWD